MHLVHVAAALGRELHLGVDELRALKLPVDLLEAFPHWRGDSTSGFRVPSSRLALVAEGAARPIGSMRLHLAPSAGNTPIVLTLLRDLDRRLDPSTRLVALVDPDADVGELARLARAVMGRRARVRFAPVDFGTIFARDNAVAARDPRGHRVLIVPRTLRTPVASDVEPIDVRAAERHLGVRVVRSRLYWPGGNILFDGHALAIGADTIAENVTRLGLTRDEVTAIFAAEFGHEVTVLGDLAGIRFNHARNRIDYSGQASYHLDLDVALLGSTRRREPVALVADTRSGMSYLPDVLGRRRLAGPPYLSASTAKALIADEYRRTARQRGPVLAAYAQALTRRGYRVIGVPQLQTRGTQEGPGGLPGQDYVYCNVLPGLNRGRPAVYYTPWGVPRLDAAAERAFDEAGARPVPLSQKPYLANAMMDRAAGLRCVCGTFP